MRYLGGGEERIHFFASRLKYSRWIDLQLVADERIESLVRPKVSFHRMRPPSRPNVTVFGLSNTAANLMFQVVNERYLHRRPMLFTTNKPLAAWGLVLHDPDLAEAILDRVLERGRLVELRGASYRTRHLKRAESDRSPLREGARISGNQGPEFPEPTPSTSY